MSKEELVYNPKTGSFDKVTAKNSKKKSNEYNPKTGSFEREPQKKLKSKKKVLKEKSQPESSYRKTSYGTYKNNDTSTNLKHAGVTNNSKLPDDLFPQIIGLILVSGVIAAIIMAIFGDANLIFSKQYFITAGVMSVLMGIGVILHDPKEEARKKRIEEQNKAAREKDNAKTKQENTTKSTDVSSGSGGSGTAFFIDNKGHVITNNHVVKGFENRAKIFYDNEDVKLKFIACDEQLDLALLKANVQNEDYIDIADKVVKKMQNIVAAGYPLGKHLSDDLKFTSGIVSSLKGPGNNSAIMQIDAALNPGNSGGPIVDKENGHLAGVAVAGLRKDVTEGINYGIKASRVKEFLQSNRITLKSKNDLSEKIDVGERLENATVYISCE